VVGEAKRESMAELTEAEKLELEEVAEGAKIGEKKEARLFTASAFDVGNSPLTFETERRTEGEEEEGVLTREASLEGGVVEIL
jgi:hypothetical protein